MSSKKSHTRKKRSSDKYRKETYYFSRKNITDNISNKSDSGYINRIIIPMYLTPDMSESIVGYYTSYNIHELNKGKNSKKIYATIITPNGTILGTSDIYSLDNDNSSYLSNSNGKKVNLYSETGSEYYKKNPQIVITVLSTYNRKLTITHGK